MAKQTPEQILADLQHNAEIERQKRALDADKRDVDRESPEVVALFAPLFRDALETQYAAIQKMTDLRGSLATGRLTRHYAEVCGITEPHLLRLLSPDKD